jgi:hypothetical protein
MPPAKKKTPIVVTNPLFRFVVFIVICIAVVTLGIWFYLATTAGEHPTKFQERLVDTCDTVFKMSAGALIGLLGGKAGTPEKIETDE